MDPTDDVYVLPVGVRRLVCSPRRKLAALVNAAAIETLAARRHRESSNDRTPPALRDVVRLLEQPPEPVPTRDGPARPIFLGLVVTRACNMACRYCDFGAGNQPGAAMSPGLAIAAIDAWSQHQRSLGERLLNLHFFGGEPFVEGDLIQIAVHRTRALGARYGWATHFEASTNGLLRPRDLAFARDYFDTLVLSLDGPQPDHDRQRPLPGDGSAFDRVCQTARVLSDSPVELCIRCCVSNANVSNMEATAEWFVREFRPSVVAFEPLTPTREAASAGLSPPDPLAFARGFVRARRITRAAGVPGTYGAAEDGPRHTFCPVGQDAFIVSPSGSVRSCYLRKAHWEARGLDLEIGRVAPGDGLTLEPESIQRLRHLVMDRPRCRTCFCRWSCAGGCLVRETWPGHGLERTDFCRQTRLIEACLLLEDMDQTRVVDALLEDRSAMETLASQADDRLTDPGEATESRASRPPDGTGSGRTPNGSPVPRGRRGPHPADQADNPIGSRECRSAGDSGWQSRRVQTDDAVSGEATFRPADGIVWAVEPAGLLVLDQWGGRRLELGYPEAASWDLLMQGRTLDRISGLLRCVLDGPAADADRIVCEQTRQWLQDGWIVAAHDPPRPGAGLRDRGPVVAAD